jgi:hypothetical protein
MGGGKRGRGERRKEIKRREIKGYEKMEREIRQVQVK